MNKGNCVFKEQYATLIKGESTTGFSSHRQADLCIYDGGVEFGANPNAIQRNNNNSNYSNMPDHLVLPFEDIKSAEVGSFKLLWKTQYTLRVHMKDSNTYLFVMTQQNCEAAYRQIKNALN